MSTHEEIHKGLNMAEVTMLHLATKFGHTTTLWQHLEPHASLVMNEAQAKLEQLPVTSSAWSQDTSSKHTDFDPLHVARTGMFDPGFLCIVPGHTVLPLIQRIGAYEMAEILRPMDRRKVARTLKSLPTTLQNWIRFDYLHPHNAERLEYVRAREVFIHLKPKYPSWHDLLLHLGLVFVATSLGTRYPQRFFRIQQRLPGPLDDVFVRYTKQVRNSSRRHLDLVVCRGLSSLWPQLELIAQQVPNHAQ